MGGEMSTCKYGNDKQECTSSPMDCQCALDAVFTQREWVGLTENEMDYWIGSNSTKKALCRAIEAALKEKNHG